MKRVVWCAAAAALTLALTATAYAATPPAGYQPAASAALPGGDPFYFMDFTDTHGDVGHLLLQTATPDSPTGTVVTSITGTLDGSPVSSDPGLFGGDQEIYSSGPPVDYPGIGLTDVHGDLLNIYYTNPDRSGPGELGICFVAGCNSTTGFYPVVTFAFGAAPEPTSWALLLTGVAMLGGGLRLARKNRVIEAV
jgi:hypothetical protein